MVTLGHSAESAEDWSSTVKCWQVWGSEQVSLRLAARLELETHRESWSFLASRVPIKESRLDVEWKKDSEHQTEQRVLLWTLEKREPFLTGMIQLVSSTKKNTELHLPLFD